MSTETERELFERALTAAGGKPLYWNTSDAMFWAWQAARAAALPPGWRAVPVEPTPEMIAAAVGAVLPPPHPNDLELARSAARLVMMHPDTPPTCTVEKLAAAMATIIPAHRAMLSAAPPLQTQEPTK